MDVCERMMDENNPDKKPIKPIVLALIITSLLVLLSITPFLYEEQANPTDPKKKIIDVDCNEEGCRQVCVGYHDVTIIYPMEECEREYSVEIGN